MMPTIVVVMGVSGSGKTAVGTLLAARLGWTFEDGDRFHPAANIDKMKSTVALTDEDRWPWLHAIAAWIDDTRRAGGHGVVACSALKRRYRDILIGARADVRLVYLEGDEALIARRIAARRGHYMPPALLHSQFEALEEPQPGERPITVAMDMPPREIVDRIIEILCSFSAVLPPERELQ
jgi:carbohydrate kinase (thermoresistant glucokinase family)